jgi:hypothetical protein
MTAAKECAQDATRRLWRLCRSMAVLIVAVLLFSVTAAGQQNETVESAAVDEDGPLRITTSDGRVVIVPKEGQQSAFRPPVISPDRTAVGAQAEYPNCCTSYAIPLELVVYSRGKIHRFKGNGLPIFQWVFVDDGRRVAYGQEPVHFGCEVHYELRDVLTEQLIEQVDVPQPCGTRPEPSEVDIPDWVKPLRESLAR